MYYVGERALIRITRCLCMYAYYVIRICIVYVWDKTYTRTLVILHMHLYTSLYLGMYHKCYIQLTHKIISMKVSLYVFVSCQPDIILSV